MVGHALPVKERAASIFRCAAAPFALWRLRQLTRDGLPAALFVALSGLFRGRNTPEEAQVTARVEGLRQALAESDFAADVYTGPAGYRRIQAPDLAHRSSIDAPWGQLLYRCARSTGARRILEIGSSAGLSGCYLAAAPECERFVTIEASGRLAALAQTHLASIGDHAVVVNGFFETALDHALDLLGGPLDLVYQDALKDADSMAACVNRLEPALGDGALLIFDDIRWSPGCWAGWHAVRRRADVTTSIDLGRLGLCVWRGDAAALAQADLSRYLGWFRVHAGQ